MSASQAYARRCPPARALLVIQLTLETQHALDRPFLAFHFEVDVDMQHAQRPLLSLRIHAQRDRGARAERRAQEFIRYGADILAAQFDAFV